MSFRRMLPGFVVGLCVGALALNAYPQEKKDEGGAAGAPAGGAGAPSDAAKAAQDEAMRKWMEVATPGAKHKALDVLAGDWDLVLRMWMAPGAPPEEQKGTSSSKWTLGGRWLHTETKGQMMGMPFEGVGQLGYDNFRKRYVMTWTDTNTTAMLTAEGSFEQDGKTLHLYGKMDEWMDGTVGKNVRYTYRIASPDKVVFEILDLDIGEANNKVIEILYTRRK
jgi:uncharacterized protein DUF1579